MQTLRQALETAITGADLRQAHDFKDWFSFLHEPRFAPPQNLDDLVSALRHHTNIDEFQGWVLASGDGHGEPFEVRKVATWLLEQALQQGAGPTAADFTSFLESRNGDGLKIELLDGLHVDSEIQLGEGFALTPFGDLPDGIQKRAFELRARDVQPFGSRVGTPPAALTLRFPLSPILLPPAQGVSFDQHRLDDQERNRRMREVLALLVLPGRPGPTSSGSWTQAAGIGVPSMGAFRFASPAADVVPVTPIQVSEEDAHKLASLLFDWEKEKKDVPTKQQQQQQAEKFDKLIIAMRLLGRSMRHLTFPDAPFELEVAAIDLRTALEAALLDSVGGKTEIAHRLSSYGAWLIGENYDARKAIFAKLKGAYQLGSDAVHTGSIKNPPKREELRRRLEGAQDVAQCTIRRQLEMKGAVNLNEVSLGSLLS
jgi:hypothetical protein